MFIDLEKYAIGLVVSSNRYWSNTHLACALHTSVSDVLRVLLFGGARLGGEIYISSSAFMDLSFLFLSSPNVTCCSFFNFMCKRAAIRADIETKLQNTLQNPQIGSNLLEDGR